MRPLFTSGFRKFIRRMNFGKAVARKNSVPRYKDAVNTLNSLQTNAITLQKIKSKRDKHCHSNIPDTISFLERTGLNLNDLDKLSIIHVSGTKGKGSTCAFCESILRNHGLKTGFYSSPHLVEVRERIRINGVPLSKAKFNKHFWNCYSLLNDSKDKQNGLMPAYFRFLTIMAFHVFLQEEVDVAIIEVGLGGRYDCTNIIRSPIVTGVTSLDLDHTSILGNTLDKIADQKAGIFKANCPSVTVEQPDNSFSVLQSRASELNIPLFLAPPLISYEWKGRNFDIGLQGSKQELNASLALQLCKTFLKRRQNRNMPLHFPESNGSSVAKPFEITDPYYKGLSECFWPGRNQIISRDQVTYFLDGAHTSRSMAQCVEWFSSTSAVYSKKTQKKIIKIVLFNLTGDRSPKELLCHLVPIGFDYVLFTPNVATKRVCSADQTNMMQTSDAPMRQCRQNFQVWNELNAKAGIHTISPFNFKTTTINNNNNNAKISINGCVDKNNLIRHDESNTTENILSQSHNISVSDNNIDSLSSSAQLVSQDGHSEHEIDTNNHEGFNNSSDHQLLPKALIFDSIEEGLFWVTQGIEPELPLVLKPPSGPSLQLQPPLDPDTHLHVLCVGSLHLIGGVLALLDSNLSHR